jgi:hypothetical protein
MAQANKVATSGISAAAAAAIAGDAATGLTATGTTAADALAVNAGVIRISTAAAGTGIILAPGGAGDDVDVYNAGANAVLVYPPTGATINSAAASFSVTNGKGAHFRFFSPTQLVAILGA